MNDSGDRRLAIRLEILGSLWGTLEVDRPVVVVDASAEGIRIASHEIAAVDSVRAIQVGAGETATRVEARVRHLERAAAADGRGYCLLGLEYLSTPRPKSAC